MVINNDDRRRVLLEFIVTHYNEPDEVFLPFFMMMALQRMVEWSNIRITVIQDGECDHNFLAKMESYSLVPNQPFSLRVMQIQHGGASAARNKGIDIANAEWVMFCDCDDSLYNRHSLYYLISACLSAYNARNYDIIDGRFISTSNGKPEIFTPGNTFIHGRLYRLDFIREECIRFPETLPLHEDLVFNTIALRRCDPDRHVVVDDRIPPWYVWIYRSDSIGKTPYTYDQEVVLVIEKMRLLLQEEKLHETEENFNATVCKVFYEFYCHISAGMDKAYINRRFKQFYDSYIQYFRQCSAEIRDMASASTYKNFEDTYGVRISNGFDAWMLELEQMEPEQKE